MPRTISIKLEVRDETLRSLFTQILGAQPECYVQEPADTAVPYLVILDLEEEHPDRAFARIRSLLTMSPTPEIFLTAARIDPEILLEALRTGVKEFFRQPIRREEVEEALERLKGRSRKLSGNPPDKKGTLLCVFGAKGGIGASTVAVNLASSLQKLDGSPSAVLVDLSLGGGDLALFLDLEPTRSFRDIARDVSRLDRTFLLTILSKHPGGLSLLPLGEKDATVDEAEWLPLECVDQTLELLQHVFDYVVVDCGHDLHPVPLRAMARASLTLLVSTLSVPVIRRTRQVLGRLPAEVRNKHLRLVMNRHAPHTDLLLKETETLLQQKAFWLIPNDYYVASTAINTGQPLWASAPKAELTRSFQKLAVALTEDTSANKERSFVASYLTAIRETWVRQRTARADAR
jgi:pilus assembly protein CpaE